MGGKRVAFTHLADRPTASFVGTTTFLWLQSRPLFVPAKMRSDLRYTMLPTRPWVDKAPNAIEMVM